MAGKRRREEERELATLDTEELISYLGDAVPEFSESEARVLREHKVNGRAFTHLTRRDLVSIGIPIGPAVLLEKQAATSKGRRKEEGGKQVYVGNLSYSTRWQTLKDHMRGAGDVEYVDILPSGGSAVVQYATPASAQKAIRELTDTDLDGRPIFIREDREEKRGHGGSQSDSTSVFVRNLPFAMSWQDLKDLFQEVGHVIRADVLADASGRSKGAGVVVFDHPGDAKRAMRQMSNQVIQGRTITVHVDKYPAL